MKIFKNPPRAWEIDDLLDLGQRYETTYIRAIPLLILEKWEKENKEIGVANFIRTKELVRRLLSSGLVIEFKPKGSSSVGSAISRMQNSRNLIRPPLLFESYKGGTFRINLPEYENLLVEYRTIFRKEYPEEYKKLYPEEKIVSVNINLHEKKQIFNENTDSILLQLEEILNSRNLIIKNLTEENQTLKKTIQKIETPMPIIADDELRNDCADFLNKKNTYIDSIRRAGVVLEERLKKTISGDGPEKFKFGVDLVDYALKKDAGKLIISEFPAEQERVHMLFRGAIQFVRNPPSHKKVEYSELEARQAVGLIDYLLSLLKQTRLRN